MSGEPGSLFIYAPNQWAPVVFAVLFGISAVGHIWQCVHYKAFKLIGLHPLCAGVLTLGYALRQVGSFNYLYTPRRNLIIFILTQVFIYICPPLLELANYHVLARLFSYVPHLSPLRPDLVLRTFGGLMALVELLNALGVALSANPSSSPGQQSLGKNLTIASLVIQLVIILSFFILVAIFHHRCRRAGIQKNKRVKIPLLTLCVSMVFIFVRSIYRTVEHTGNTTVHLRDVDSLRRLSPLLRYEVFFYLFEASLMFLNSVLWNVWHPGRFLPQNKRVHLAGDGVTEVVGPEDKDDRKVWQKILHVVSFGLLFRNQRRRGGESDERKREGSWEELRLREFPTTHASRTDTA